MNVTPDPWHLDAAPNLAGLLTLVGPANRTELLARLRQDLLQTACDLSDPDPAAQKRGAHVLTGLAGTLGATGLQARAREVAVALAAGGSPETAPLAAATRVLVADLAARDKAR